MDYVWLAVTLFLSLCISDLHKHNDTVGKMFPDYSNERESEKRRELTVSLGGLYFVLIICIIMSIRFIISLFVK